MEGDRIYLGRSVACHGIVTESEKIHSDRAAPNSLSQAERELIATYVSSENDCYFCQHAHGAAAAHYLGGNESLVQQIKRGFEASSVSDKLKALLAISGKVQKGGKQVTEDDIARARGMAHPIRRFTTLS